MIRLPLTFVGMSFMFVYSPLVSANPLFYDESIDGDLNFSILNLKAGRNTIQGGITVKGVNTSGGLDVDHDFSMIRIPARHCLTNVELEVIDIGFGPNNGDASAAVPFFGFYGNGLPSRDVGVDLISAETLPKPRAFVGDVFSFNDELPVGTGLYNANVIAGSRGFTDDWIDSSFDYRWSFETVDILKNAVVSEVTGPRIDIIFSPSGELTLSEAASCLGYENFNWISKVLNDPYGPEEGIKAPYIDPPHGGYKTFGDPHDNQVFYWDVEAGGDPGYHLDTHTTDRTLSFVDIPFDPRLQRGEQIDFMTSLVGVYSDGSFDILHNVYWSTNYTTKSGGAKVWRRSNVSSLPDGIDFEGSAQVIHPNFPTSQLPFEVLQLLREAGAANLDFVPEHSTLWLSLGTLLIACLFIRNRVT